MCHSWVPHEGKTVRMALGGEKKQEEEARMLRLSFSRGRKHSYLPPQCSFFTCVSLRAGIMRTADSRSSRSHHGALDGGRVAPKFPKTRKFQKKNICVARDTSQSHNLTPPHLDRTTILFLALCADRQMGGLVGYHQYPQSCGTGCPARNCASTFGVASH